MKYPFLYAAAAMLPLAACGQQQKSATGTNAPTAVTPQTYSGEGKVVSVAGDQVTISHRPIQGIGWPAMTMTFSGPRGMTRDIKPGDEVSFSF